MARPAIIPPELMLAPFHLDDARALGVSRRRLAGASYERLLPGVWRWVGLEMTERQWWAAARAYAPPDARFTGATRLQQLGLDLGPHRPMQMVVPRDLHRVCGDVFLHRTDVLPPHDDHAVSPEAVFVEVCRWFSVLDAVAAGDWLVGRGLMSLEKLEILLETEPWRDGVDQARWVVHLLDSRARSVQESRVRVHLQVAGLPRPEVNTPVEVAGTLLTPDWWWHHFRAAAEFEGAHHQVDRRQYVADIDRYALYRRGAIGYRQITNELLARTPREMVRRVHALLVEGGYAGPAPMLGGLFDLLGSPCGIAMGAHPQPVAWRPADAFHATPWR